MARQMLLPLAVNDQDVLRRLWEQIPAESRDALTEQYTRVIVQAARDLASDPPQPEASREDSEYLDP